MAEKEICGNNMGHWKREWRYWPAPAHEVWAWQPEPGICVSKPGHTDPCKDKFGKIAKVDWSHRAK